VVAPQGRRLNRVRDSKMLTSSDREVLFDRIMDWADAVSVAHASHRECDELGMSAAQKLAAQRVLTGLGVEVDHVLVDGPWDFVENRPVTTLVKGDRISLSIAAASVIAKVTRDRLMRDWAEQFPAYALADNKGYPCPRHQATLARVGPCPIHRQSWSFMDDLRWTGLPRFEPVSAGQQGLF
jgi:ribonuclease HII